MQKCITITQPTVIYRGLLAKPLDGLVIEACFKLVREDVANLADCVGPLGFLLGDQTHNVRGLDLA